MGRGSREKGPACAQILCFRRFHDDYPDAIPVWTSGKGPNGVKGLLVALMWTAFVEQTGRQSGHGAKRARRDQVGSMGPQFYSGGMDTKATGILIPHAAVSTLYGYRSCFRPAAGGHDLNETKLGSARRKGTVPGLAPGHKVTVQLSLARISIGTASPSAWSPLPSRTGEGKSGPRHTEAISSHSPPLALSVTIFSGAQQTMEGAARGVPACGSSGRSRACGALSLVWSVLRA